MRALAQMAEQIHERLNSLPVKPPMRYREVSFAFGHKQPMMASRAIILSKIWESTRIWKVSEKSNSGRSERVRNSIRLSARGKESSLKLILVE